MDSGIISFRNYINVRDYTEQMDALNFNDNFGKKVKKLVSTANINRSRNFRLFSKMFATLFRLLQRLQSLQLNFTFDDAR